MENTSNTELLNQYLKSIDRIMIQINKDLNYVLNSGWLEYYNNYSDKALKMLEDISKDLGYYAMNDLILNISILCYSKNRTFSLRKFLNLIKANPNNFNLSSIKYEDFYTSTIKELDAICNKKIYSSIFECRDKIIAHIDCNKIIYYSLLGTNCSHLVINLKKINNEIIIPLKKIIIKIFNLFSLDRNYNRINKNPFKKIYTDFLQ